MPSMTVVIAVCRLGKASRALPLSSAKTSTSPPWPQPGRESGYSWGWNRYGPTAGTSRYPV
jgi:hypothetical protein